MNLKKITASLLAMALISTFALAYFPRTATASPVEVVWLTHWTEPGEKAYWDAVIAKYQTLNPDVIIQRDAVEFEALYQTIMMRHAAGEDPDIIHHHAMWIPTLSNWRTKILAIPDPSVQQYVTSNWKPATVSGSTYKDIVWGYPTEFNSWTLVYNREVFNRRIAELTGTDKTTLQNVLGMLEADTPLSYQNLTDAAKLLTKWTSTGITQAGFVPFVEGMPEEQRFQFLSLLSSNGGEYVNLAVPEAVFDSTNGYQVMQLYHDLGYVIDTDTTLPGLQPVYDPMNIQDYWWQAWIDETIGMIVLPTWMTYVRDASEANFNHLGIAPIPIGPSGTESRSMTYNWLNTVSQRAVDKADGTAEAAWAFLEWLNSPKAANYITVEGVGRPIGEQVSLMGDYLIYDSIVPSRTSDIENGRISPGVPLTGPGADFWFSEFIKFGSPPYGKGDKAFLKGEEAQYQIGLMFERVTLLGDNPTTAVNDAAKAIGDLATPNPDLLTMAGDVNINGIVEISDAVSLIVDWGATPAAAKWNRGRSEIVEDIPPVIDIGDATILSVNYGKVGGSI